MKKMMLVLAMIVTIGISGAFAREENVSKRVLNAFKTEFATAQDVIWSTGKSFYKAEFTMNGQRVFAYYSTAGELIGIARYISSLQLPLGLLTNLKNNYSNYWISDLFELSNTDGTHYYLTLEKSDASIMLVSTNGTNWTIYDKKKKV